VWECNDPTQIETTEAASAIIADAGVGQAIEGRGVCLPTDHAGVVAVVDVSAGPDGVISDPAPPAHDSFRIGLLGWLGILLGTVLVVVLLVVGGVVRVVRRRRRARVSQP
jgi:hypothetical protein